MAFISQTEVVLHDIDPKARGGMPVQTPYRATLSGRRMGAIGAWENFAIEFSIQGAPRELNLCEQHEAAIKAAGQFGWEVNHVQTVVRRDV